MIGTTITLSKVLLDVGLDTSTADLSYIKNPRDGHYILVATPPMSKSDIPCWSMGKLWQICQERELDLAFVTWEDPVEDVITSMVKSIFDDIKEKEENQN